MQSCCAASWRQRVKIQLVVSEKKRSSVYGRAGCGEAPTVEIAADFLFFPLAELKSPPRVWLEQKEGSERNRERKRRERERERKRGGDSERTVKGRNAPLMMK